VPNALQKARVRARIHITVALAAVSSLAIPLLAGQGAETEDTGRKAFVGARFLPLDADPVEDGVLLTRYGRITALGSDSYIQIPPDAEQIDLKGRFVVPGFVNAHGHVGGTRGLESGPSVYDAENVLAQLRLYARYGVTTVFSLGGDRASGITLRDELPTDTLDHARLFVAGPVLDPSTPADAVRQVRLAAAMNVDVVKIRVDDQLGTVAKMPDYAYREVIKRAHDADLPVAAHVFYLEDAKGLLRAGVDFIAHSIRDQPVDDELIELLLERNVCVCPTLTRELSTFVYAERPDFFDDPFFTREAPPDVIAALQEPGRQQEVADSESARRYREALEIAKSNLARLAEAGVRIAFGTDSGPPGRFQGYFEHLELAMMVEAGLTPAQALRAATVDAAACSGQEGRVGSFAPGAWADFIVLEADPSADIINTRRIDSVWVAGNRVPPSE
jgi:imidazolonepropionase-like amidohydrolase